MLFISQAVPCASVAPDLEKMMAQYGDGLLRLCFMYLRDYQLAEDALQETFIRAYTKYHTFKGQSSEKTWITRISINVCKSLMRKRSFKEIASDEMPEDPDTPVPSTEEEALENTRNEALYRAVLGLSPIYREVILLFYYGQFQISEVAKILKVPEGSVKARLFRARAQLAELVKEDVL